MATKTLPQNRKTSSNGVAPKGPTAELVTVTPELARTWIAKNIRNRNLRISVVRQYARDMKAGNWQITGEAIKFDLEGNVLDGQHRLAAILDANVPIQLFVIHGLPVSAQDVMDTGAKRSPADALHLNGYAYSALLAAGARLAIGWERGQFDSAWQTNIQAVTNSEVLEFVDNHDDFHELVKLAGSEWRRIPAKPAVILFTAWATSQIDLSQTITLYDDLAEMRTSGKGDPRATLLSRLNSIKTNRERTSAVQQADMFFRTWNAVRTNRPLTKFSPKKGVDNFTDPK